MYSVALQGYLRGVHREHVHLLLLLHRHLLHPRVHGTREGRRDPGRRQERPRTRLSRLPRGRPPADPFGILGRQSSMLF